MPSIINIPKFEATGWYPVGGWDLIRISDPAQGFSELKFAKRFSSITEFEFLDADDGEFDDCVLFQKEQASKIIDILIAAKEEDRDVLVHCNMGRCRSGAIAEVGVLLGFEDSTRPRQPNLKVKRMLIEEALERNLL